MQGHVTEPQPSLSDEGQTMDALLILLQSSAGQRQDAYRGTQLDQVLRTRLTNARAVDEGPAGLDGLELYEVETESDEFSWCLKIHAAIPVTNPSDWIGVLPEFCAELDTWLGRDVHVQVDCVEFVRASAPSEEAPAAVSALAERAAALGKQRRGSSSTMSAHGALRIESCQVDRDTLKAALASLAHWRSVAHARSDDAPMHAAATVRPGFWGGPTEWAVTGEVEIDGWNMKCLGAAAARVFVACASAGNQGGFIASFQKQG